MKGISKRLVLLAASGLFSAALFAGCGSDGSDGANGANGTDGINGIDGTNGVDAAKTAVESCDTCHGVGKTANVDTAHSAARWQNLVVTTPVVTNNGTDLVVTFNVKVNNANKTNYDAMNVDYRLDGATMQRRDLSTDGTTATLTGGTLGNYTITIAGGAVNAAINSRYLFRVQNTAEAALATASRPAGYRAIVQFDYPAAPVADVLGGTSTSCADCHGSYGNGFHYGYPSNGGKTCVVCHDASNTTYPLLPAMIHGIHQSGNMPTGKYTVSSRAVPPSTWDYSIKFPSYMQNCSVCHTSGAPLTAANSEAVTYELCMSCHQNWNGYGTGASLSFHTGYTAATNCAACHDGATAPATVGTMHNRFKDGTYTANGGLVYNGEDLSVKNGDLTDLAITGVTRTGSNLAITWTATYNGVAVNPCNATPSATTPSFAHTAVALVDHGVVTTMAHNFSFLKAFFQGDDLVNAGNGNSAPGQPNSVNVTFAGQTNPNTVCSANVATTTIALTAAEAALTNVKARVGLQGKPVMNDLATTYNYYLRAKSPVYDFKLADGTAVAQRRAIADTDQCLKCHVGSLYQHGGNRVDSVELCVMCHNEASSDQNNRVAMGVTAAEAYDGKVGQTYGFKTMLHAVHASGNATFGQKAYALYRTRGIYGFALTDAFMGPNWPLADGATKVLVYGADPALAVSMQPHNFATAHYPRPLNDCLACHKSDFSRIPDPTKAVATTFDAGAAPWDNQLDDVLQGPAAAACTSCHNSASTGAHASREGFFPSVFEMGRQSVINPVQ